MRLNTQSIRARFAQRRSQAVEPTLRKQGWYAPNARASVGHWRSDLTATERRAFIDIAGELLVALGYAPDHAWADNPVEARS